jgi:putative transposase
MAENFTPLRKVCPCVTPATPTRRSKVQCTRQKPGALVADIVRELGISEATLYAWKKRIDGLGTPEIRQLRGENAQLNQVVDDLTRDRQVCNTCSFEKTPISNAFQLDESISDSEHTRRKTAHST